MMIMVAAGVHKELAVWLSLLVVASGVFVYLWIKRVLPLYYLVLCSEKLARSKQLQHGDLVEPESFLLRVLVVRAKSGTEALRCVKYLAENSRWFEVLSEWRKEELSLIHI